MNTPDNITPEEIENLPHAWTAEVEFFGGQTTPIWWTAWQSTKHMVKTVLWIATDLPKQEIYYGQPR